MAQNTWFSGKPAHTIFRQTRARCYETFIGLRALLSRASPLLVLDHSCLRAMKNLRPVQEIDAAKFRKDS